MADKNKLPKIADVEREALYGYVFGVSGPGVRTQFYFTEQINHLLTFFF